MAHKLLTFCCYLSTLAPVLWGTSALGAAGDRGEPEAAPSTGTSVDIRAVGDTGYIGGNGRFGEPPARYVETHLAGLAALRSPDINLLNLEGSVTTKCQRFVGHRYRFAVAPAFVMQLASWGFNFFALANNHAEDCLAPSSAHELAMRQIRQAFPAVAWHGVAARPGLLAKDIAALSVNGVRVGMVSLKAWSAGRSAAIGNLDNRRPIFAGLAAGAYDLRILSLHGGTERQRQPAAEVVRVAREFIGRYGGDVVFAHHPHVMQGVELLRKEDGRYGVIFYSLGNHLHNGLSAIGDGLLARVVGTQDGIDPRQVQAYPLGRANQQPHPLAGAALTKARLVLERSGAFLRRTPLPLGLINMPFIWQSVDTPVPGLQAVPRELDVARSDRMISDRAESESIRGSIVRREANSSVLDRHLIESRGEERVRAGKVGVLLAQAPVKRRGRESRWQRLERSMQAYAGALQQSGPAWWQRLWSRWLDAKK